MQVNTPRRTLSTALFLTAANVLLAAVIVTAGVDRNGFASCGGTADTHKRLRDGKIAFVSDRDGNKEIYVMNADGTGQARLTHNKAEDYNPAFSPSGDKIAFVSERAGGSPAIYMMNVDGTNVRRLTISSKHVWFTQPAFRPDGKKIVFMSLHWDDGNLGLSTSGISVMNADGMGYMRLTKTLQGSGWPSFSPDGRRIIFVSNRNQNPHIPNQPNADIYVMNADGTQRTRLTKYAEADLMPAFSPDGCKIVFVSYHSHGGAKIYLMNADGSKPTRLTNKSDSEGSDFDPVFSPDGHKIAFTRDSKIYVMNINGKDVKFLAKNCVSDGGLSWRQ